MLFKSPVNHINLFENREVSHWMKKWGVNADQFSNAIIETGTTNIAELEQNLRNKGLYAMPVERLFKGIRKIFHLN